MRTSNKISHGVTGQKWEYQSALGSQECRGDSDSSTLSDPKPLLFRDKKGALCVLGCYIDDSADHGRKTVFSVGGFVAEGNKWFDIDRHWVRALKNAGVDYFRTYECANLEGEFRKKLVDVHGLTTARVIADALLADLKQIIATSDVYAFSSAVLMADYRQVLGEPDGSIVLNPDPYVYGHYQLIGSVLAECLKFDRYEICAFLYDESSKASLMQSGWEGFKKENPNWGKHAGTLAPIDDKTCTAIQMADLLAYTTTKMYASVTIEEAKKRGESLLKAWLKSHIIKVIYADAEYLRGVVAANLERVKAHKLKYPDAIIL